MIFTSHKALLFMRVQSSLWHRPAKEWHSSPPHPLMGGVKHAIDSCIMPQDIIIDSYLAHLNESRISNGGESYHKVGGGANLAMPPCKPSPLPLIII